MSFEIDIFERLATLRPTAVNLSQDDVELDPYLWSTLYQFTDGDQTPPAAEDIAEITHFWGMSPEGYASTALAVLGRLVDDRWFSCNASCDTSGFDCRGYVDWHVANTREGAIALGLDKESRNRFGLSLSTEETHRA
jgi:hypothetical protein